jgi:hypothetical protein
LFGNTESSGIQRCPQVSLRPSVNICYLSRCGMQ